MGALEYRRSQPWPFPHSLMLAFRAEYESGEITCDGEEIADAAWFAPDELPNIPGPVSIARWLIDDWVTRQGRRRVRRSPPARRHRDQRADGAWCRG